MSRRFSLAIAIGAALVFGLASAQDAQAWFGRGGSNGSCGSSGGSFSGGSNGSSGSHGGLFRGLFSGRSNGSCGSSGGSYNGCGSNDCGCNDGGSNNCGCGEAVEVHETDGTTNPPVAPRDPGQATPQAPSGGGASATIERNTAIRNDRLVIRATPAARRPLLFGR